MYISLSLSSSPSPPMPPPLYQSLCPFSPLFLCCMYHLPSWCWLWKSRNLRLMAEAEAATAICIPYDMISLLCMAVVHRIVSQQIKHPSKKQCYTQSEIQKERFEKIQLQLLGWNLGEGCHSNWLMAWARLARSQESPLSNLVVRFDRSSNLHHQQWRL